MQNGYADLIESTKLFIEDDPVVIELAYKPEPVKKPGGGYDNVGQTQYRDAQVFKLIPQSDNDGFEPTEDAAVRKLQYVLVGLPDAEIEIGDSWVVGKTTYRVTGFHQHTDYQIKASILAIGGSEFQYG